MAFDLKRPQVTWNREWRLWVIRCEACGEATGYEEREDAETEARNHICNGGAT